MIYFIIIIHVIRMNNNTKYKMFVMYFGVFYPLAAELCLKKLPREEPRSAARA